MNREEVEEKEEVIPVILVLGSAANPVHNGHLQALAQAAAMVESQDPSFVVQAAYIACAPNGYCRKKYKTEGYLRDTHRLALLFLACDTNKLVRPTWRTFGSAQECAQALRRENMVPPETRIVIVRGEDRSSTRRRNKHVRYVTIARPVGAISATAIRQSVRSTGGIAEAVANGWVPAAYLEYVQQHDDALHSLLTAA